MSTNINTLLYHYTDNTGLLGMLEKTSLDNLFITMRATFYHFLNDPSEYQFGVDIVNMHLTAIEDEFNIDQSRRLDLIQQFIGNTKFSEFDEILSNSNVQFKELAQYYISFTSQKDNLPFWGMYAKNGNGICIEFDTNKIEAANLRKIIYLNDEEKNDNNLKEVIKQYYLHYSEMYDKMLSEKEAKEEEIGMTKFITEISRKVILYFIYDAMCSVIKKASYEHEGEYRLKVQDFDTIHYRSSNGLIIPYVEKKIPIEAITKIVVGPTLDFERCKMAIQMVIMCKLGFEYLHKIKIEKSEIAYRG